MAAWLAVTAGAAPLETTFTYQGQLTDNAVPAEGTYDFEFVLFDVANGGSPVASTVQRQDVNVSAGVFSVELDFGSGPFAGDQLWLAISVREGTSSGGFTGLLPRQKLTAAPYALHAEMVGLDAIASAEIINNTITAADLASNSVGAAELATNAVDTLAVQDGAITQAKLAAQAVGQSQIISTQVQRRVGGDCAAGSAMAGVSEDGSVSCVPASGYTDGDAVAAVLAADGAGSQLDADLLDGQQASEIIAAAADEVAEPITQADLPLTIDTSGSYYVTENLSYPGQDDAAIRIIANDVTLDLRGFSLTGDGLGTGSGIEFFGAQTVIHNGRVARFGGSGVEATLSSSHSNRLERLVVSSNGGAGITISASNNTITDCTARSNGGVGIAAGGGSLILRSIAQGSGDDGINVGSDSNVELSTALSNLGAGFRIGARTRASDNVASNNVDSGIFGFGDNSVLDNRLTSNNTGSSATGGGIRVNAESYVSGNALSKNSDFGIYVAGSGTLIDNNMIAVSGSDFGLGFAGSTTNAYRNNVVYNQQSLVLPSADDLGGNAFYRP